MTETLPIDEVLPELAAALDRGPAAVLAAPPGAGKTTRVPLALMDASWAAGRILMLEPRRLAARAAAERMAESLGEPVGARIGYRIRGESRTGPATRVEVVTEGVLTRMLQSDPELPGIAAVIFDEVHERSIHTDLGLALTREVQEALRPELRLLAMSATLDTAAMARTLGGAPVIESAGRMFPVETHWLDRPAEKSGSGFLAAVADRVLAALGEGEGDVLVFLPGAGEIARVAERLSGRTGAAIRPLHGGLSFSEQRRALMPEADGRRRVVLATSIAETSLTVAGVRIVVDAGRARRARTAPATGMSRLVTEPVSRAEADQRRGRAGRTAPGLCHRLWTRGEEGGLPAEAPPEILAADLAPLALELAVWGVGEPRELAFPDPPPARAMAEARALLHALGALDAEGRITPHGRAMAGEPLHPRLAHMRLSADAVGLGPEAALLAALLSERDPLRAEGGGRPPADLGLRMTALIEPARTEAEHPVRLDRAAAERIRAEAARLDGRRAEAARARAATGALLARAYPDRIGLRRPGDAPRWRLSGGRGAAMAPGDPLAGQRLLVAADLDDTGREATIRRGAPVAEAELRAIFPESIAWENEAHWSRRERRVIARQYERLGAIALAERHWRDAPPEALGRALAEGIRDRGLEALPWPAAARSLRARVAWLRAQGGVMAEQLPDLSDSALLASLDDWLTPWLGGLTRIEEAAQLDLHGLLAAPLEPGVLQNVKRAAPAYYVTPLGESRPIDYSGEVPTLAIRVQELFGVTHHPAAGDPRVPLLLELLSPAGRPLQLTRDLPGFWSGAWAEVAREMRARYPKHPWPDDPAAAQPTRRSKSRR